MPVAFVSPDSQSRQLKPQRSYLCGFIMWLPKKEELGFDVGLDNGCYHHPVVILSHQPQHGKVVVLLMTSFNETDLEERHPTNRTARLAHLPIKPCDPHPDNLLCLELGQHVPELRKRSYVNTETQHTIEYKALRPYERRGPDYYLSSSSYRILIDYANFTLPVPNPYDFTLPVPNPYAVHFPVSTNTRLNISHVNPPVMHTGTVSASRPSGSSRLLDSRRSATREELNSSLIQNFLNHLTRESTSPYAANSHTSRLHGAYPVGVSGTYGAINSRPYYGTVRGADGWVAPKIPKIPIWKILRVLFVIFISLGILYGFYDAAGKTVEAVKAICARLVKKFKDLKSEILSFLGLDH